MKNKKLLNFYMLTIALVAIISFLLPIDKLHVASQDGLLVMIPYYVLSGLMMVCLVLVVIFALLNMFKNEYEAVQPMKAFSFIAFVMVMIIFVVYSMQINYALSWGFLLIATEVFALFAIIPIVKTVKTFKNFGYYMSTLFPRTEKPESEEKKDEKVEKVIKTKPTIIKKDNKVEKQDTSTKSEKQPEQVEEVEVIEVDGQDK